MKIDVTAPILDINNEPLMDGDKPLTLRVVLQTVLLNSLKNDDELAGEAKVKLWTLANDTLKDQVDWTPEDVSLVRARIGVGYGPVVVGPAWAMLG